MDTVTPTAETTATAAESRAQANLRGNLSAMASLQSELAEQVRQTPIWANWVFGRDGFLTTRTPSNWWSGCSVTLLAGRQMLKKLELTGTTGCFLNPANAGQIRACFEKLQPTQAVIAVVPEIISLKMILTCEDFSNEFDAARLFFVAGKNWPEQLETLVQKFPGLPLPQQFIRTILLDDADMVPFTTDAQAVISRETSRRAERLPVILARNNRPRTGRVLVLAGSRFNLADLSNLALRRALIEPGDDSKFVPFDPDHPLTASPLALAEAAADVDAIITADLFRADLPGIVSPQTPWITWITRGRLAGPDLQAKNDVALLANSDWRPLALEAGWPKDKVNLAGWPEIVARPVFSDSFRVLGLLTDTCAIEAPQRVKDFSSQLLLWEMIENELSNDPLSLGDNPNQYLQSRMIKLNISDEGFDRNFFLEKLIAPAYKGGLTLFLLRNGVPMALYGRGWMDKPEFKAWAKGPIENPDDLTNAVSHCHAVLQPFPACPGATAGLPLPVIQPEGLAPDRLLARVRQLLNGKIPRARSTISPLTRDHLIFSRVACDA
jgi:hypothetical protein